MGYDPGLRGSKAYTTAAPANVIAANAAYRALSENAKLRKTGMRTNAVVVMFIRIAPYSPIPNDARPMKA